LDVDYITKMSYFLFKGEKTNKSINKSIILQSELTNLYLKKPSLLLSSIDSTRKLFITYNKKIRDIE